MESGTDESTLPYETTLGVAVSSTPATSSNPPTLPFSSLSEYIRYLIRSELQKTLQASKILQNPLAAQAAVPSNLPYGYGQWPVHPFNYPPYKTQPNYYYPPYYGPYNPYHYQPAYQPYYSRFMGPVGYKTALQKNQIEARRPFPSVADEQLSDDDALAKLNSLKADHERVSERFVQPSVSLASDYSSLTITFPSIYSVLNSLQAVANQLTTLNVTTKTVLIPGISIGG